MYPVRIKENVAQPASPENVHELSRRPMRNDDAQRTRRRVRETSLTVGSRARKSRKLIMGWATILWRNAKCAVSAAWVCHRFKMGHRAEGHFERLHPRRSLATRSPIQ